MTAAWHATLHLETLQATLQHCVSIPWQAQKAQDSVRSPAHLFPHNCLSPLHYRHYSSPCSLYKCTVHIHHILSLDILKTGDLYYHLINFESIPSNHICSGSSHSFAHQAHKFGLHFQEHPSNKPTTLLSYIPWSTEGSLLSLLPVSLFSFTVWNAHPHTQCLQSITAVPLPSFPDGLNTVHQNQNNNHCTEK